MAKSGPDEYNRAFRVKRATHTFGNLCYGKVLRNMTILQMRVMRRKTERGTISYLDRDILSRQIYTLHLD